MAAQVTFVKGNPEPVDYTPGTAVAAGDVVVVGQLVGIAHRNIAANELGALFYEGGMYEGTADGAITAGALVYWNDTTNKLSVTANAGANRHIGYCCPDSSAAADGDKIRFLHKSDRAGI